MSGYDAAFAAMDANVPGPVGNCTGCFRCRAGKHGECHGCSCRCFRGTDRYGIEAEGTCCIPELTSPQHEDDGSVTPDADLADWGSL